MDVADRRPVRCGHCNTIKSAAEFAPSQRRNGMWCRACFRAAYQQNRTRKLADVAARYRGRPEYVEPRIIRCAWCGSEYQTPYTRTKYCNRACKDAAAHSVRPKENGAAMARITRGRIAKRDGWACALCGALIDYRLKRPDKWSASVDHRMPVSRGGGDEMENLQLAHLYCNMKKSDSLPTNF